MALQTPLLTDTWVTATWEEYLQAIGAPESDKGKSYYDDGRMRLEMAPVGSDHSCDHTIVSYAVTLYAGLRSLDLQGRDNCTFRKPGLRECQPDIAFHVGKNAAAIPYGTGIVDLNIYPPPDLVIEVAKSSLADDQGAKRLLYEDMGVPEYWIVDVNTVRILAFAIEDGGSRRIAESGVLPGLQLAVLVEALQLARKMSHGKVSAWLLSKFQATEG
ncbi:Uma2 family endonuclease [Synechococcus sp. PCC 7336]|uniref:Uma2 family endonuclease n=1 Tax=Synechococcus sp. PCC 7336 TaxID=195250 RepID=UPI00034BEE3F|nr:Uma2 family endonuclease [Synechococcus sp. PCC 7336]